MHRLLLLVLACAPSFLAAQTKAWPREFKARPAKLVLTTEPVSGNQIATSKHFRFNSEVHINRADFERFAKVVESVPQLVERFPLPLWSPPSKKQIDILIFKNEANFLKAGGQKSTIGWYDGSRSLVLIRADYFLTPPAHRPTRLAPRPNQDLLVHELVHACMHGLLRRLPPWLSEGAAEYLSSCHKGGGYYTFHDVGTSVRDRVRNTLGQNSKGEVLLLPIDQVIGLDHKGWMKTTQNFANGNPYLPYATSLLLAHYHLNGGQSRRTKTATYLQSLHGLGFREPTPAFPAEKAADIEARLVTYWKPRGLNLVFSLE